MKYLRLLVIASLAISLSGCDTGFQTMGPTERGVKFRILPPSLGGGVSSGGSVIEPGETSVVMPWEKVYRFDTSIQKLEWGAAGEGSTPGREDYVQTRALDGNEVALAVKVEYHVSHDPERLVQLLQSVGTSNDDIRKLVIAVARSDIRTYMNDLKTSQFFDNEQKYGRGQTKVFEAMSARLHDYGIIVDQFNLGQHRFERELPDGQIDSSYQQKIDEVQTIDQETENVRRRKDTVIADKKRELALAQAGYNRSIAEADGVIKQATLRGDNYFKSREFEAKAILSAGQAEVEGVVEKINALSGPGGEEILKLEIARQLILSNAKYVLMGNGEAGSGLDVNKVDTNELLRQIGIVEGLKKSPQPKAEAPKVTFKQKQEIVPEVK